MTYYYIVYEFAGASTYVDLTMQSTGDLSEKGIIANGIYCHLSSYPRGTAVSEVEDEREVILYNSRIYNYTCVLIRSRRPEKLVSYLAMDRESILKQAHKALGLEYTPCKERKFAAEKRTIDTNTEGIQLLQRILRECPKVPVTKPKLLTVKQYIRKVYKRIQEFANADERPTFIRAMLDEELYMIRQLKLYLNDSKCLTEDYQYPVTQEQYNALCLMQSFNTEFSSCQSLCIDRLKLSEVQELINTNVPSTWEEILLGAHAVSTNVNFCFKQVMDFDWGFCDRFFQLTEDGFIRKRFHIYYYDGEPGVCSFDNFYNTSPRHMLTIGNVTIESLTDCDSKEYTGYTYKNESLSSSVSELLS